MKRFTWFLPIIAALLVAAPAWGAWTSTQAVKRAAQVDRTIKEHTWTSTATDSDIADVTGCQSVEARFDPSTGDASTDATVVFRDCETSTSNVATCRILNFAPASETDWYGLNVSDGYLIADAQSGTAGGDTAKAEYRCDDDEAYADLSRSAVFNVVDYGATAGSGVDESHKINDAIDAACASGASSTRVYIPAGVYHLGEAASSRFYSGIQITCSGVHLFGDGKSTELRFLSTHGMTAITVCSTVDDDGANCLLPTELTNVTISDLYIYDDDPTNHMNGYDNVCVDQSSPCDDDWSIPSGSGPQTSGSSDGFCDSDGVTAFPGDGCGMGTSEETHGITLASCTDCVITRVHMKDIGDEGVVLGKGAPTPNDGPASKRVTVSDSFFEGMPYIPNGGGSSVEIAGGASFVTVTGNTFFGTLDDPTGCTTNACINKGNGIAIGTVASTTAGTVTEEDAATTDIIITENKFVGNETRGDISFGGNNNAIHRVTISDNLFDKNDVSLPCDTSENASGLTDKCAIITSGDNGSTDISVSGNIIHAGVLAKDNSGNDRWTFSSNIFQVGCPDLYDTGSPQSSGEPDSLCDDDGTTAVEDSTNQTDAIYVGGAEWALNDNQFHGYPNTTIQIGDAAEGFSANGNVITRAGAVAGGNSQIVDTFGTANAGPASFTNNSITPEIGMNNWVIDWRIPNSLIDGNRIQMPACTDSEPDNDCDNSNVGPATAIRVRTEADGTIVSNNRISDMANVAIYFDTVTGGVISGNTLIEIGNAAGESCIDVDDSTDVLVSNNYMVDCGVMAGDASLGWILDTGGSAAGIVCIGNVFIDDDGANTLGTGATQLEDGCSTAAGGVAQQNQ